MDDAPPKKPPAGAPGWILTFADLMSLLLAFFVLLFSFSEIDKQKFKELAGSLKNAFGVQREIHARETPIGTSMIAREFSPARTDPSPINEVRQTTVAEYEQLAQLDGQGQDEAREELETDVEKVKEHLQEEIAMGLVDVEDDGQQVIIIRIREKGSFPSGSADLRPGFEPVMAKIASLVNEIDGAVAIAGHTDDRPISTARFRSNWELSAARAATVLHRLVDRSGADIGRFRLSGHAETRPLDTEDSDEARARNRRVEVILLRGALHEPGPAPAMEAEEMSAVAPPDEGEALVDAAPGDPASAPSGPLEISGASAP